MLKEKEWLLLTKRDGIGKRNPGARQNGKTAPPINLNCRECIAQYNFEYACGVH